MRQLAVYGSGGHAKVVIDAIKTQSSENLHIECYDDDPQKLGGSLLGVPIVGGKSHLMERAQQIGAIEFTIAIGDNQKRMSLFEELIRLKECVPFNVIHPTAYVSPHATIYQGVQILAHSVVQAECEISQACIINNGCVVEHDCILEKGVHVAPNATLLGSVVVGANTLVGAGAVLLPSVTVGPQVTIGAGAVVTKKVDACKTILGNPAREHV